MKKSLIFLLIIFSFSFVLGVPTECSDGIDNDNDGLIDWQYDLSCYDETDPTEGLPTGVHMAIENGWTVLQPTPNETRIIYVSSSTGDDLNDGLTPASAVATIDRGYFLICEHSGAKWASKCSRDYTHDWLLLKRGDTFRGDSPKGTGPVPNWHRSGKDSDELVWIATYGDSKKRPVIVNPRLTPWNNYSFIGFKGLELYKESKDPDSPNFSASGGSCIDRTSSPGNIFIIEDNLLRHCAVTIAGSKSATETLRNLTLRRNVIYGSHSTSGGHSQGSFFGGGMKGLTLIENVYDMNGWIDEYDAYLRPNMTSDWTSISNGRFSAWVNGETIGFKDIDFSGVNNLQDLANVLQSTFNSKFGSGKVTVTPHDGVITFVGNFGTHPKVIDVKSFDKYLEKKITWTRTGQDSTNTNIDFDLRLHPSTEDLNDWKTTSNAEFSIRLNGTDYYMKNVDFTTSNDMHDIAIIMQNEINTEYQSKTGISNAVIVEWEPTRYSEPNMEFRYNAIPWVQVNRHKHSSVEYYPGGSGGGIDVHGPLYLDGANGEEPDATQFNHNIYIPSESVILGSPNGGVVLQGNILSRPSASAVQVRPGGDLINNLIVNHVGGHYGRTSGTPVPGGVMGNFRDNVIMNGTFTSGTDSRGGGGFEFSHIGKLTAENNLFVDPKGSGGGIGIGGSHEGVKNLTVKNNIVYTGGKALNICCHPEDFNSSTKTIHFYDNIIQKVKVHAISWQNLIGVLKHTPEAWMYVPYLDFHDNKWWDKAGSGDMFNIGGYKSGMSFSEWTNYTGEYGSTFEEVTFPDPSRSVESYHASLGRPATFESFITEARKQSRFNWRPEYTAAYVNEYMRAGFGMTTLVCGDSTCSAGETCGNCPGDCGICPVTVCGDSKCEWGESCSNCPGDCGICGPSIPYCGDNSCNAAETCKTCPGDCGTCTSTNNTSTNKKSGGGGSSGSTTTLKNPPVPTTNPLTRAQKFFLRNKIYRFETKNRFIKQINLKMAKDADKGSIELSEKEAPSISISKGRSLQTFEITPTLGLSESTVISSGEITFSVPKQWIEENYIDKTDGVKLARLDNEWEYYDAILASEEDTEISYIVEVPGFSEFIIIGLTAQELMIAEKNQKVISMAGLSIALIIVGAGIAIIIIFLQVDQVRRRKEKVREQVKKSQELVRTYIGKIGE